MRFVYASIALVAWACIALGQQSLEIKGDVKTVEVERLVPIKEKVQVVGSFPFTVVAPAGAADYAWKIPATITATEADEVLTVTAAPKGSLAISCKMLLVDFEAKTFKRKTVSITFAVGEVAPAPEPKPPEPGPMPTVEKVWLVVVHESEEATTPIGRLLGDLDYWRGLEAKGHKWRFFDKDNPVVTAKGYPKFVADAGGVPCLIIMATDGKVIKAIKLPADKAAVDAVLKEIVK